MLVPRSKYLKQLDDLSVAMEDLGQKTIADVTAAGLALAKGDTEAAEEVISGEMRMRRLRATIEDTCLDIMLMQQPLVADDLRYVSGSFRLVIDLAHIDSKSRDVAYLATQIPHEVASAIETEIATASGKVAYMVKTALESFADADRDRAEEVFASDDEVDALYERAEQVVVDLIRKGDADATHLPELLMAAKYFERMGDDSGRIASRPASPRAPHGRHAAAWARPGLAVRLPSLPTRGRTASRLDPSLCAIINPIRVFGERRRQAMVYCVEDDASIRELALYALTQAGIEAEGMANDVEFRAACARRLPDVVMLDIMLPGADGLEILHRIRNTPGLSRVPVIMVTAKSTELDIVTALDGGADEYLTKPYGMMEMVSRVRALLRRAPDWGNEAPQGSSDEITIPSLRCATRRSAAASRFRSRRASSTCSFISWKTQASPFPAMRCCSTCGGGTLRAAAERSICTSSRCARNSVSMLPSSRRCAGWGIVSSRNSGFRDAPCASGPLRGGATADCTPGLSFSAFGGRACALSPCEARSDIMNQFMGFACGRYAAGLSLAG